MKNYQDDFGPFDGKVWLNCASEGPLPKVSIDAAHEAVEWKRKPFELTLKRFSEVPKQLKVVIGQLLNVNTSEVILGNSATYGIHLLANGLALQKGDEVVLMQNDFPTDILPWLGLQNKGVVVKQVKSAGHVVSIDELLSEISASTKVVCLPHVHTFSGHTVDIQKVGEICRDKGIVFIANLSQSLGNQPVDVSALPVDAITTAAFKWLLGPYGTGFCWIKPELRKKLDYNQAYWSNVMSPDQYLNEDALTFNPKHDARQYDVFGTANFFNFYPLTKSIEYLLSVGLDCVCDHNQGLVGQLIDGLNGNEYTLISQEDQSERSNLVVFSHKDDTKNKDILNSLAEQGIYLALWKNKLRAAPHIFNTNLDIDRLLSALHSI